MDKKTLQEVLREKAQQQQINTGNVTDAALKQLQQSRQYGQYKGESAATKPAGRGEVTMDKFLEDIRYLFDEGAQLGYDKSRVVQKVVGVANELAQAEKAQAGAQAPSTATSAGLTTQFSGAQTGGDKPAAPPAEPSSPRV